MSHRALAPDEPVPGPSMVRSANGTDRRPDGSGPGSSSLGDLDLESGSGNLHNILYRQLFENSPAAIVLLDLEDRVLDANRAFEAMFGYPLEEAKGRTINALIVPEGMRAEASELSGRALSGGVIAVEEARRRKDGSLVDVSVLGYPIFERGDQIGIFGIYSDLTERRRFERKLRLQSAAMDSAVNAIFMTDDQGRIVWANRAFTRLSGYLPEEAIGRLPTFLDPRIGVEGKLLESRRWLHLRENDVWRAEVTIRGKDGSSHLVEQTVTQLHDPRDAATYFVVAQEDISDRRRARDQLRRMARQDFLTDLPNRYSFSEQLEMELGRARSERGSVAVLVLDLDHFKDVNDTYGHPAGDELLIAVSRRLRRVLRKRSTLARLGGDEFAVIQTDLKDVENARGLARRLLSAFSEPFTLRRQVIHASASLGISVYPPGDPDPGSLVKKADMAMYKAKGEGRGSFRFFEEEMDREVRQRMRLGQDLHGAVEKGELFLEYQPLVSITEREIVGVEALIRWQHPSLGCLEPDKFIPIAEGSGLIIPIGEWALEKACVQARQWGDRFGVPVPIAVNVSSIQFRDPRFVDTIAGVLSDTGLDPELLFLELTEGTLMQASAQVERSMEELRRTGVQLCLDDFGKGYSSLEYLRRLPLERLKIDRTFVQGVGSNTPDPVIVSVVMTLGRKLGLKVVAEGIETEEQLAILSSEGCSLVQGYLLSRPLRAASISKLFASGNRWVSPLSKGAQTALPQSIDRRRGRLASEISAGERGPRAVERTSP